MPPPQLRQCLDPDTYQLFTQKLTELELMRDPKFIWCIQVGARGGVGGVSVGLGGGQFGGQDVGLSPASPLKPPQKTPQCSFGFIFEAEQGPAQCPQCQQRFCPRCQRPVGGDVGLGGEMWGWGG